MPKPSQHVLDRVASPRYAGSLDPRAQDVLTGIAVADDCGDVIQVQLKADAAGVVLQARHKTYGCAQAIAASEMVCEMCESRELTLLADLAPETVARKLETPDLHAVRIAVDALRKAIIKKDRAG